MARNCNEKRGAFWQPVKISIKTMLALPKLMLSVGRKRIFLTIFVNNKIYKIMALEITDATFEETVLKSDKPVLVDFWAAWCGPCRMVGPIIDEISKDYDGKAVVGKVDVDANQEFAAKYGVRNIPTVLVFNGGELVGRQVGVAPKNVYTEAIDSLL
tara:strand:+ start:16585 stop:17055 length:471 start_codon:yes stop_codon:yes gene_type:complete